MTDIRSRHAKGEMPALCHHDPLDWPCDTILEADRADAAESLAAEAVAAHHQTAQEALAAIQERDKAEAALAECRVLDAAHLRQATEYMMAFSQMQDDAERLYRALDWALQASSLDPPSHWEGQAKHALAAHKEATE
jgi:hypothetical protein